MWVKVTFVFSPTLVTLSSLCPASPGGDHLTMHRGAEPCRQRGSDGVRASPASTVESTVMQIEM